MRNVMLKKSKRNSPATPLPTDRSIIVSTSDAARMLNRKPQTLRKWSCLDNGPIRPVRINGRLAWRIDDLERIVNGDAV